MKLLILPAVAAALLLAQVGCRHRATPASAPAPTSATTSTAPRPMSPPPVASAPAPTAMPPARPVSADEQALARMRALMEARDRAEAEASQRRAATEHQHAEAAARRGAMKEPPANPNVARNFEFDQVRVFFATDRQATAPAVFGGGRGEGITYGSLFVSIPRRHEVGAIERPSVWRLEFSEDPRKHMVIVRRRVLEAGEFYLSIRDTLSRGGSDASFVFVHGYNVAFDDAARRTAQITYDLDFHGVPVFYSWPSQASLRGYTVDAANVEWSTHNLKEFLRDYAQRSEAKDIYLIAHSMGNRALTRAVAELFTEQPEMRGRFKEIILTAPDVDADVFKREIAPKLVAGCDQITLYVSDGDKALLASREVHGHSRLGDSTGGIPVVPGVETIDASGLDTSFLEHSYFAETGSVLKDIRRLVLEGLRAAQRGLTEKRADAGGRYWKFETAPR